MAIDFGRMARGVATGYLSAKIANTEANDQLNADIHKAAGVNYQTNTLPNWQKKERVREREFKQIANFFESDDIANFWGEQGAITGEGNSLDVILKTLEAKNRNPNDFKKDFKWEGSTYEDRYENRLTDIQDAGRIATGLSTGSSKIGPMTVKNQLEGFGKDKEAIPTTDTGVEPVGGMLPGGEKEPSIAQVTQSDVAKKYNISDIYGVQADEQGVESKFNSISTAVNQQMGYGEPIYNTADGSVTFNIANDLQTKSNAHIALASSVLGIDNTINQIDAVSIAEQELTKQTVTPFNIIASSIEGAKYSEGVGKKPALVEGMGGQPIDAETTTIKEMRDGKVVDTGISIYNFITDIYTNDLLKKNGSVNKHVFKKFIENLPINIMYKGEKLSEVLANAHELQFFKL